MPLVLALPTFLPPPPSPSAASAFLSSTVISGHCSLVTLCFPLGLRTLEPALDTDSREEVLVTCCESVLCLPPSEGLDEEVSDPIKGRSNVIRSCVMVGAVFLSFTFERMQRIGLAVLWKDLLPPLTETTFVLGGGSG